DGVNEEWLTDKARYAWDGLRRQRLDQPYIREDGKLRPAGWGEALSAAAAAMKNGKMAGLVGDLVSVEAISALKALTDALGGEIECRTDGAKLPAGNRSAYVGTAKIEDIDDAQAIMLIGTNPRAEAPVLNARIRKAWSKGAKIGVVGEAVDLTYDYFHLGTGREGLRKLVDGDPSDALSRRTLVIVGMGALTGNGGKGALADAMAFAAATESNFMVLHTAASRVGALDLAAVAAGGLEGALSGATTVYNLGADEVEIPAGPTVIYQGSHGDRGTQRADIVLPAAAWTEENGLFVNTEGRPQLAMRAGFPPGEAKENWAILRALSGEISTKLPYDSLGELRSMLVEDVLHLKSIDEVPENEWVAVEAGGAGTGDFASAVTDHYLTNPILRASPLMGELQSNARARKAGKLAAE
ncbi:MAG: molybdopterin-dependent oxidoreductase, partial [Boseongicola sp.]